MNYTDENKIEKPVIIIDETASAVSNQDEGEVPVITIENDDNEDSHAKVVVRNHRRRYWVIGSVIISVLFCLCAIMGYKFYRSYYDIGISVSATSEQVIQKLKKAAKAEQAEVVMTSDSVLGVAFRMYEIRGLKAEVSFDEPDTTDMEVYLYSRCSDFTSYDIAENHYIGSLVVNGVEKESSTERLGYCAMANDNIAIGIARDEDVKDYCVQQGGSFFRQFILVSNGQIPLRFHLHGKVERRGMGRIGDKLYYIETLYKETMWDFADALREYGFNDAIYITGGSDHSFYRTIDGAYHHIGDTARIGKKHKGDGIVPWVVFKKR